MADIFNRRRSGKILDVMPFRHQEWIDEPDGTISLTTYQDVQPTIDQNKKDYNNFGDKLTPGKRGEFHKVASIPLTVWEQWKKETNNQIEKDPKLLNKYLNDSDNKFFRTAPTNL
jgi:hypothetical protein|tara:strand:+ start:731 stop:1075 length:345 start_codon:yes stop_codon:yes gene_type:complete